MLEICQVASFVPFNFSTGVLVGAFQVKKSIKPSLFGGVNMEEGNVERLAAGLGSWVVR